MKKVKYVERKNIFKKYLPRLILAKHKFFYVILDEFVYGYNQVCPCNFITGRGNFWISDYGLLCINSPWSFVIFQSCY